MRMNRYWLPGSLLTALIATAGAQAQGTPGNEAFSYTFGQAQISRWDYDDGLDVTAATLSASLALDSVLFARAGLSLYDGDVERFDRDRDTDGYRINVGLGMHTALAEGLDLVVAGDLIGDDHDRDDDIGFGVEAGVRHATLPQLELSGGVFFEELYDSETGLYGKALWHLNDPIAIGAEARLGGDVRSLGVFARYNFF